MYFHPLHTKECIKLCLNFPLKYHFTIDKKYTFELRKNMLIETLQDTEKTFFKFKGNY